MLEELKVQFRKLEQEEIAIQARKDRLVLEKEFVKGISGRITSPP